MNNAKAIIAALLLCCTTECEAVFVAGTSFENESVVGVVYIDTGDPLVDHDLINNSGQRLVDSTASSTIAGDLGFDAFYVNTRDSVGLGDGDVVGVTDDLGINVSFFDGTQGYRLSDPDGLMRLTFDPVTISGLGNVELTLNYLIQQSQWGSGDLVRVFVDVDGASTNLLNESGVNIRNIDNEEWVQLSSNVSGNTATLVVELDSDSPNESLFIDNVAFNTSAVIPEPSAFLFCAIVFGGALARRCAKWLRSKRPAAHRA